MTSVPFVFRGAWARLRYARARLILGISGVGTSVLIAVSTLALDLPRRLLSTDARQPWWAALSSIGLVLAYTIVAFACFDLVGGAMFVRRTAQLGVWLRSWWRGVIAQWVIWMLSAAGILVGFRQFGIAGSFGFFVTSQCFLAAMRGRLSRIVAAMPVVPPTPLLLAAARDAGISAEALVVVECPDESFVGGWAGIRAKVLVVPARWSSLPQAVVVAQLARRRAIATSGAHWRGVIGAVLWNCLGFALVVFRTEPALATASGIVTLSAGMTLWAFFGVLLLPTISRSAVHVADRDAAGIVGAPAVCAAIVALDQWQDDEPTWSNIVETIFHPVPGRASRVKRLTTPSAANRIAWMLPQAHHLARHALWLSWAALTPLSRAVHCNVGRPALWVMLPGD